MEHQQRSRPGAGGPAADTAAGTWEAIEPYQIRPGFWRGRAQATDGHTTQSELCDHPGLTDSRPGHDDQSAAWACGQELAATLRAEHIALDSTLAGQVRTALGGEYPAGMVTDDMVRSTVHGLIGSDPLPACPRRHSYLVADPGDPPQREGVPPLYEGADFDRACQAALSGVTSLGRCRAQVTASHGDTRPCPEQESRVRRVALGSWLAGQHAATAGDPARAGSGAGSPGPERTPQPAAIAIGELVISWNHDRPMQYGGPGDGPYEEVSFGLADKSAPTLRCELPARRARQHPHPRAGRPGHREQAHPGRRSPSTPQAPGGSPCPACPGRPGIPPSARPPPPACGSWPSSTGTPPARPSRPTSPAPPAGRPGALDEDRYLTRVLTTRIRAARTAAGGPEARPVHQRRRNPAMTCGHTLGTGQAGDLAAWFAAHLPMDLRIKLMAERPLLYEALFPGCPHGTILDRVATALRSQAHDRMIATSRAAEHLLQLVQGTDHPWEGSDTVDAVEGFLAQWGTTIRDPARSPTPAPMPSPTPSASWLTTSWTPSPPTSGPPPRTG